MPNCDNDIESGQILDSDAIDLLAERLITPLQINQHLVMALEAGHSADESGLVPSLVEKFGDPLQD